MNKTVGLKTINPKIAQHHNLRSGHLLHSQEVLAEQVRVQAAGLGSRWLAIDDSLHDTHPSLIEPQRNIAYDAFLFLKLDDKASHYERIVWTFAGLARFPKAHTSQRAFSFGGGGFLGDRVNGLRDLRCEARHHILAQLISPILPANLFLNRHVLHFQLATVARRQTLERFLSPLFSQPAADRA